MGSVAQQLCPVVVGRDAELEALRASLTEAVAGTGRAVLLVGEPGIGKSRLAREVAGWAIEEGVPVATGRAVPATTSAAFRPMTEALLQLFRRRPLPDDAGLERWLPLLQPLLPALIEPSPAAEVPPGVRGEAVLQLLGRAAPGGVVVILEDLHWADPDTVALVEYLGDNVSETSLLLVLTLRDGPASDAVDAARRLRGRSGVNHLALGRLGRDDELARRRQLLAHRAARERVAVDQHDPHRFGGWPLAGPVERRDRCLGVTRERHVHERCYARRARTGMGELPGGPVKIARMGAASQGGDISTPLAA